MENNKATTPAEKSKTIGNGIKIFNIIFIVFLTLICLFNVLVVTKAINLPKNIAIIVKIASLCTVVVMLVVYWVIQFVSIKKPTQNNIKKVK